MVPFDVDAGRETEAAALLTVFEQTRGDRGQLGGLIGDGHRVAGAFLHAGQHIGGGHHRNAVGQ